MLISWLLYILLTHASRKPQSALAQNTFNLKTQGNGKKRKENVYLKNAHSKKISWEDYSFCMKTENISICTNMSWEHLCCRRQGKESIPGRPALAALPEAALLLWQSWKPGSAWIRTQGPEQPAVSRVWTRDPAMPLWPKLSHNRSAARHTPGTCRNIYAI